MTKKPTKQHPHLTAEKGLEEIKDVGRKIHAATTPHEKVRIALAETIAKLQAAVDLGATGQDIVDQLKVIDAAKLAANLQANT